MMARCRLCKECSTEPTGLCAPHQRQVDAARMMERTRATVCYVNTARNGEERAKLMMHGFMSIFHPEVPPEKVRELARDASARERNY